MLTAAPQDKEWYASWFKFWHGDAQVSPEAWRPREEREGHRQSQKEYGAAPVESWAVIEEHWRLAMRPLGSMAPLAQLGETCPVWPALLNQVTLSALPPYPAPACAFASQICVQGLCVHTSSIYIYIATGATYYAAQLGH